MQRHYAALFEDVPELTRGGANMVFAGEQDDPATVEALGKHGLHQPLAGDRGGARLAPWPLSGGARRHARASG